MNFPLPPNETQRLEALRACGILDSAPEQSFDDIVRLAAHICSVPISAVSLVDSDRQWFKARVGLPDCQTDRAIAFCSHAILEPHRPLIIEDASKDSRFSSSPLVTGSLGIRFYAGIPLVCRDGFAIGSLCVKDAVPRSITQPQLDALTALARQVMYLIEARQLVVELAELKGAFDEHAIVAIADLRGQLISVNDRFCAISRYDRTGLLPTAPDFRREQNPGWCVFADAWDTVTSGSVWRGEVRGRTQDGEDYWMQTTVVPIKTTEGKPWQFLAMGTDIGERRRNEESLRLLSSALEQTQDSVTITDAQLELPGPRIVFVNAAFTAMTGYSSADAIGRTPRISQGPKTDPAVIRSLRETLAQGGTFRGETVNYRKDGTAYDLEWQVAPIRDAHRTVTHFVAVQRDITQRKAAESALATAREGALEAVRLKSRFLANMSHELRTPLNTINGLSATLAEDHLPPHAKQAAALILECGENLLENIQTILTHSSLEAGKTPLDAKRFRLEDVVLSALRIAGGAARAKHLGLDCQLDPGAPAELTGDPFRLQQILVNLLANAIKFTDAGHVLLRLRARQRPEGIWRLRFSVADSGIGIAPANLGKLFKPFSQADDTTTRRFEGTGLGLALAKSLVELMGGTIGVRSRPGVGSIFSFTVSLQAVSGSTSIFAGAVRPELAGKRVLIIEPDAARRRQLTAIAQSSQLVVSATATAELAAVLAAHESYHFGIQRTPPSGFDPVNNAALPPLVWLAPHGDASPEAEARRFVILPVPCSAAEVVAALASLLPSPFENPPAPQETTVAKLGERLPLRILSADDTRANREGLKLICRHLGYRIDTVENGAEVLEKVATTTYDLILLDVQMPVLDGLSAAREICRLQPDPKLRPRLVAVTASVQTGDREHSLAAGMDEYLSKPVLPKDLRACIEHLFGAGQPATSPGGPAEESAGWVDLQHLETITSGMETKAATALLRELYTTVRDDSAGLQRGLTAACAARQATELIASVHSLKGCVLLLGWTRLGRFCQETLSALHENRFSDWTVLPAEIDRLFRRSAAELDKILSAPER